MPARPLNPASAGRSGPLKLLGTYRRILPGTETIAVPRGTTMVRFEMKGGGGAGGQQANNNGNNGGGEAQTERRFISLRDTSITVTVGQGGRSGYLAYQNEANTGANLYRDATASTALGYTAQPGKIGNRVEGSDNSQPGADGYDPTRIGGLGIAYGNFSGASSQGGTSGAGPYGGFLNGGNFALANPALVGAYNGAYGCGGAGPNPRPESSVGGAGGDGYIVMEFYG